MQAYGKRAIPVLRWLRRPHLLRRDVYRSGDQRRQLRRRRVAQLLPVRPVADGLIQAALALFGVRFRDLGEPSKPG